MDRDQLAADHTRAKIHERLSQGNHPGYLSDFIYGALDGTVTTFAVVSGVAGADLSSGIIIVLGIANLVGDGFSMAAGNYLGTRVDQQLHKKARDREAQEIETYPEGEREEVRQIFSRKGFSGPDLDRVVEVITENKSRWIDTMMTEELGMQPSVRSPFKAGAVTMLGFLIAGSLPLLSFIIHSFTPHSFNNPYRWSCLLTAFTFFSVGAFKSRFVNQNWYWSGGESLVLGGSAAGLAYLVGMMLHGFLE